ncbi:UDP-N-acetylmuramoyl-L-alanine--D-glutamate ligase [Candidatus Saccharibacteria bacterium]|nr:UDP-N-acetylmuramoyl-L-alanine--D-glutamate ligase [Candidatus Saccharibacteria bacterium]
MNIAILGYGSQGVSAYKYWNKPKNKITICDSREKIELPKDTVHKLGSNYLSDLKDYDLIIRAAPIIHPKEIVDANNPEILDKVTSNTNEFFRVCPTKNIIGVTGTKGKGTTSTLIARILEASGKRVHLGGNIGIPPLELLNDGIQPEDWVVLELANFQLIDLKYSPPFAVCLMVVPEHLDWHEDIEEYIAAKQQLFINQSTNDYAIFYADNEISEDVAEASEGKLIPYFKSPGAFIKDDKIFIGSQEICDVNEIALLGKHNWQNVCAAITTTWQIIQDIDAVRSVVTNFSGLPFRIEFRRQVNGINYYNDSFASAGGATLAALNAIIEPKIMIVGGYERGLDLSELAKGIRSKSNDIRKVILIGETAKRTAMELKKVGFDNFVITDLKSMLDIVKLSNSYAQTGDAVVLSPGFASFDMFMNFEDRGNKFNEAVEAL